MNAFLEGLNQLATVGLAALLNTLWYAAAVVALTWAVLRFSRRVDAATRYWIWTAVLGFLVVLPFLPALVAHVEAATSAAPAAVAPLATVPAVPQAVQHLAPVTLTLNSAPGSNPWPLWLLAVWVAVAGWQLMRLLRGAAAVRRLKERAEAVPGAGMPIELHRRVQVLASEEINSPVAVGYRRPAVIIPAGLLASLEEAERQDVLLHELAHLGRYDDWLNLATRTLGAILVLHPLAGIVLKQIEREREMACDDFVVVHTGSVRNYARSLARMHDLRSTEGTRLLAPALLGRKVSLADRIESLLRHGRGFSARPSLATLGVGAFLMALLLGAGGLIPGWIAVAQISPGFGGPECADLPKSLCADLPNSFEVASIRPASPKPHAAILDGGRPGRLRMTGLPLETLVLYAYRLKPEQLDGLPSWAKTRKYTIQAEARPDKMERVRRIIDSLPPDQKKQASEMLARSQRHMIQSLLADRFSLKVHRVTKPLPVYELVVAKGGPKLKPANMADFTAHGFKQNSGTFTNFLPGKFDALGASPAVLADELSQQLGRIVIDRTGIVGRYDFTLTWDASLDEMKPPNFGSNPSSAATISSRGPSIFTAIQEQLGLKLKATKGPVQVLVVDHIEPPTPN